jgi:tryptophan-rich sensory protein
LTGYASYRVYKAGKGFFGPAKIPLLLYSLLWVFNWLWSPVFFHYHLLDVSAIWFISTWVIVVVLAVLFFKIDKIAGLLLVPYIAWGIFGGYLAVDLWKLNS